MISIRNRNVLIRIGDQSSAVFGSGTQDSELDGLDARAIISNLCPQVYSITGHLDDSWLFAADVFPAAGVDREDRGTKGVSGKHETSVQIVLVAGVVAHKHPEVNIAIPGKTAIATRQSRYQSSKSVPGWITGFASGIRVPVVLKEPPPHARCLIILELYGIAVSILNGDPLGLYRIEVLEHHL